MRALLTTTALALALAAPAVQAQNLSRADVEAIVRDYIAKNGDQILQSVTTFQRAKQQQAVSKFIRAYTPTRGPATAPVTIVEFADFECPYCYKVEPTILELQKRYGNQVRWAFKYLPLEFHKNAMPASQAAAAAHNQGKFWEFSKVVFENQDKLGEKLYTDTAQKLGLDMKKFNADRTSAAIKANIAQDLKDAAEAGAQGTPFFFINGQPLSGALPLDEFTKIIDPLLKPKK